MGFRQVFLRPPAAGQQGMAAVFERDALKACGPVFPSPRLTRLWPQTRRAWRISLLSRA